MVIHSGNDTDTRPSVEIIHAFQSLTQTLLLNAKHHNSLVANLNADIYLDLLHVTKQQTNLAVK